MRRMWTEWLLKIKEEVTKQLKVGFIKLVNQAEWIANVVPMPKKNGRVRMCVDFRELNKACPEDDFPFPHIDVLVDNIVGIALMSSWMIFRDTTKSRWLLKILPKLLSLPNVEFIVTW